MQSSDPEPHQREWFTHVRTGDRGYKVLRDGKDCIRLDRPNEEIVKAFAESEWNADREHRPLSVAQMARLAFEADKQLCFFLRLRLKSLKEWESLSDRERMWWMERGPQDPARKELYESIFGGLRDYYR